ncbi:hypothetical protein LPJ53_006231, partial [Coemansia erecta]
TGDKKTTFAVRRTLSTHVQSHVNAFVSEKFLLKEREAEAQLAACKAVEVPDILALLGPKDYWVAEEISSAIDSIGESLETYIGVQPSSAEDDSYREELLRIVSAQGSGPSTGRPEARMYPGIRALVHFVVDQLDAVAGQLKFSICTRMSVHTSFDKKPEGSDDLGRIDLALVAADSTAGHGDPVPESKLAYANMISIVEAKAGTSKGDELNALAQIYRYSRNMYYRQFNRRFVWGITVCGSKARACLLLPDGIFTSASMDLHSSDGRKNFIRLIVLSSADGTFGRHKRMFGSVGTLERIGEVLGSDPELIGTYPSFVSGGAVVLPEFSGGKRVYDTTDSLLAALGREAASNTPRRTHVRLVTTPYAVPAQGLESADKLVVVAADVMAAYIASAERCDVLHRDITTSNMMYTPQEDGNVRGVLMDFEFVQRGNIVTSERPFTGYLPFLCIQDLMSSQELRSILDGCESMLYILSWFGSIGAESSEPGTADYPISLWRKGSMSEVAKAKARCLYSLNAFVTDISLTISADARQKHLRDLVEKLYKTQFQNKGMTRLSQGAAALEPSVHQEVLEDTDDQIKRARAEGRVLPWDHDIGDSTVDPFERRARFAHEISKQLLKIILDAKSEATKRIEATRSAKGKAAEQPGPVEQLSPPEQPTPVEQLEAPEQPVSIELPGGTQDSGNTDDREVVDEPKESVFKKFSRKMHLGSAKQK